MLSATGLYKDIAEGTLATDVIEYTPRFPFWSDGAGMRRFARFPPGARIDVRDMDHWSFPQGTRFWKTFDVGGVVVETDLIEKTGPNPGDVRFTAYAWRPDGKDAELAPLGVKNARGTGRDIPSLGGCTSCHGKLEERIIGFSALQLSHAGAGMTPHVLNERGLLSASIPDAGFAIPGDATTVAALGYLHANCGHCHYERTKRPMHLRLKVSDRTVEETAAYRTGVQVDSGFKIPGVTTRIAPGHPETSAVHYRMSVRIKGQQMPNWGTSRVDEQGLASVDAWIAQLAPRAN
jgi:mono/diheme cytochrome c family protein